MRLSAAFIIVCMGVIAASLGASAYLALGFSAIEAGATALAILSALFAYNAFASRNDERAETARQISELSRGIAELARQVGELGRRVITVEAAVAHTVERTRASTDPLSAEMEVLGGLVKQLAESVAAHEMALLHAPTAAALPETPAASPPLPPPLGEPAARLDPVMLPISAPPRTAAPAEISAPPSPAAVAAPEPHLALKVRDAIEAARIDLFLQAIVTLPQRKARYYEASTWLRTEEGALLAPAQFLPAAESLGLVSALDLTLMTRAAQIAERLAAKSRDVVVFHRLSRATLSNADAFAQAFEFFSAHRGLARVMSPALAQRAAGALNAIEQASITQIAELGFRFALDDAQDLRLEPRRLSSQGFRYVRTPAAALLSRGGPSDMNIHPSDLANLLSRHGIDLIADGVETEGAVVDLLDYELRFAQGPLFAAPRPVRPEVFAEPAAPAVAAQAPAVPRRREEPPANARPSPEGKQGLAKIARTIMRRA